MTPKQIKLVQSSWASVFQNSEVAAKEFYNKLFDIAPDVKPMFKNDMDEQGRKLMQVLNTAVVSLDNLPALIPVVEDLGRRHVGYGVTAQHYDAVGSALVSTLSLALGEKFTAEVKEAWLLTYSALSNVMKEAAATTV